MCLCCMSFCVFIDVFFVYVALCTLYEFLYECISTPTPIPTHFMVIISPILNFFVMLTNYLWYKGCIELKEDLSGGRETLLNFRMDFFNLIK